MNLKELCKEKGTNINRLAEQIGVNPSTLYSISSGDTTLDKVGVSTFIKISNALGYTADELYSLLSGVPESPYLTEEEQELVEILRSVSTTGKAQLMEYARFMAHEHPKNPQVHGHKAS